MVRDEALSASLDLYLLPDHVQSASSGADGYLHILPVVHPSLGSITTVSRWYRLLQFYLLLQFVFLVN